MALKGKYKDDLVPAAGVEPATFRSGGERSNPLSYAGLTEVKRNVPLFVSLVNIGQLSLSFLINAASLTG